MKSITLLNPELARDIFKTNGWYNESEYFIKVEGQTSETLCSASLICTNLTGEKLTIGFGSVYTIRLEEFSHEIEIQVKNIANLGVLLTLNQLPYLLRVFGNSPENEIMKIGDQFPELQMIDFGSEKNEHLKNLKGIVACTNLNTLNLDYCANLQDISGLSSLKKLKILWLDGFSDSSQFKFIASCKTLIRLSQNNSQLSTIEHISGLSMLAEIYITNNSNLSEISHLSDLPALETINVRGCKNLQIVNLSDLSSLKNIFFDKYAQLRSVILSNLDSLSSLDLSFKMIDNSSLTKLELSSLPLLKYLNLSGAENLFEICLTSIENLLNLDISLTKIHSLAFINACSKLEKLDIAACNNINDFNYISKLTKLNYLNAYGISKIKDYSFLKNNTALQKLNLGGDEIVDFKPYATLPELNTLIDLDLSGSWYIENLDFVKKFPNLASIGLRACCEKLRDISPLSYLTKLSNIDLGKCSKIINISSLRILNLNNLELFATGISEFPDLDFFKDREEVNFSSCHQLKELKNIEHCKNITLLNLSDCTSLKDISPLKKIESLKYLNLMGCSSLFEIDSLSQIKSLIKINLSYCDNITRIYPLCSLTELSELYLTESPNIRDMRKLASLNSLTKLEWIDNVECSYILMRNAINRVDSQYILENIEKWINELKVAKEATTYSAALIDSLLHINGNERRCNLLSLATTMRIRGLQSDEQNDLDAYTWETWCNLAIELDKADTIACLQAAVNALDIARETEVILGPAIMATAELIERYPDEKEALLAWVQDQLQLLENHPEEQRQIAPSAAVFFASLNKRDDVLYWMQKATDAKAPLWRERVLHALVKHYAHKENFTEARQLLDEMQIQDEKDHAIAALAQAMSASHPVEAGFLLDEIQEANISSDSARKLLQQPSMLLAPQGIYQLLLHLQSNPDELASALEMIIERDTTGGITEAVKQLFIQTPASGPSAAVLLELCKHPSIADFVKPRALEKYKSELRERVNRELSQSVPHLIAEMQNAALLEDDEAQELATLLQST